jgi:salicylate hydroxylase
MRHMGIAGTDITILGAGIGGLAAGLALAQRGARVRVLERSPGPSEHGAGIQVTPNASAVLAGLGLGTELAAIGVPARAVVLRDHARGAEVLRLDLHRARHGNPHPYLFVHRVDLAAMLAAAAVAAGVRLDYGQNVTGLRLHPQGCTLRFSDGRTETAPLLVGADGVHSQTRSAIAPTPRPAFTGQAAWRAVVPETPGAAPGEVTVWMGPGRHLVSYPLRGGSLRNIVAIEERAAWTEEGWNHPDDPAAPARAFRDFAPEVAALLARCRTVHLWGLFRHPVARHWHSGRAVILGDAAHPTLPFLAQGANMALEDAWVLAAALAAHPTPEAAFAAYQARRIDRVRRIVAAANGNARAYHLRFPPLRLAAHSALRLAGLSAPRMMLGRFDWLYGEDVTAA